MHRAKLLLRVAFTVLMASPCACRNAVSASIDLGGTSVYPSGRVTTPTSHRPTVPACNDALPGCSTDADCAAGQDCFCDVSVGQGYATNQCLPSNCRLDSDCASGYCSPSDHTGGPGGCGGQYDGWYCHVTADECGNDDDCVGANESAACMYSKELGHWTCVGYTICAG